MGRDLNLHSSLAVSIVIVAILLFGSVIFFTIDYIASTDSEEEEGEGIGEAGLEEEEPLEEEELEDDSIVVDSGDGSGGGGGGDGGSESEEEVEEETEEEEEGSEEVFGIVIDSPPEGDVLEPGSSGLLVFTITVPDDNLDSCRYEFVGDGIETSVISIGCFRDKNTLTFDVPDGEGSFVLSVFASNTDGEEVSDSVGLELSAVDSTVDFDTFITSSRTIGFAPLSVHFDAIGNLPWEEIEDLDFQWDFDDGATFNGYLAAHVYEQFGEYEVTLTVRNLDGESQTFTKLISVSHADISYPGDKTICFSGDGVDWTGCPSGAQKTVTANWDDIKSSFASDQRILLKTRDLWEVSNVVLDSLTNVYFGSFGTGDKPTLSCDGCSAISIRNNNDNIIIENIRFVGDLTDSDSHTAIEFESNENDIVPSTSILIKDVEVNNFGSGFIWAGGDGTYSGRTENVLFDNILVDTTSRYGFGIFGFVLNNFALLDSTIRDASQSGEHAFRTCIGEKGLLNNVRFESNEETNLHLRGRPNALTKNWQISDSYFEGTPLVAQQGPGTATTLQIRECVGDEGGEVSEVIFERNIVKDQPISNEVGNNVLIRNNLLLHSHGVSISSKALETKIYNNVQYSDQKLGNWFIRIITGASSVEIVNNIYSAENILEINSQNADVEAKNLEDVGIMFSNSADPEGGGLTLQADSPGIDEGSSVVVRDLDLKIRPIGIAHDVGAYEFGIPLAPPAEDVEEELKEIEEEAGVESDEIVESEDEEEEIEDEIVTIEEGEAESDELGSDKASAEELERVKFILSIVVGIVVTVIVFIIIVAIKFIRRPEDE